MIGLTFERAEWWPLLLLLPVVWLLVFAAIGSIRSRAARFGAAGIGRTPGRGFRATLWSAIAGLLILTWLNPQLGEERLSIERRGLDVVFCLDTSRSMLARDVSPDRISRARRDIRAMLPELVGGDRVALLAFAGDTRLVTPLTHDLDAFSQLLEDVDTDTVRTGGSDLAKALRRALEVCEPDESETTVIVMLTDGEDLEGAGKQAAAEADDAGVIVHTVGYGSTRGSKITLVKEDAESFLQDDSGNEVVTALDAESLRAMSERTGGEFLRADAVALPLVELKRKRFDPMVQRSYDSGEEVVRRTRFQWVLLPVLLLLLIELWLVGGSR